MPVADFMCGCGYAEDTVIYKVDKYPPCPECGDTLVRDHRYGFNLRVKGDGYGSFVPIDMGVLGYCDTKEKYDAACATIKQRYPNSEISVDYESDTQKRTRIDEHRHKVDEARRKKGIDYQALNAAQREAQKAASMGAHRDEVIHKSPNELISPSSNKTIQRPPRPALAGKSRVLAG